jgi:hypothetical protein
VPDALDDEDVKLVTLARASRARTGTTEAAAVRDGSGRTYVATAVELPTLRLSALQAAVAAAVSSGADGLEAAVVVTAQEDADADGVAAVSDLAGAGCLVLVADPNGSVLRTYRT